MRLGARRLAADDDAGAGDARNMRVCGMLERAWASPSMIRVENEIARTVADVRDVLPGDQGAGARSAPPGNRLPEAAMRYVAELLPNASYEELAETDSLGAALLEHSAAGPRSSCSARQ